MKRPLHVQPQSRIERVIRKGATERAIDKVVAIDLGNGDRIGQELLPSKRVSQKIVSAQEKLIAQGIAGAESIRKGAWCKGPKVGRFVYLHGECPIVDRRYVPERRPGSI
jgi:hypothetical protein